VVLADHAPLGTGQTIASQGILHRGVKYAMSTHAAAASDALANAQAAWESHFQGRGCLDLRGLPMLSSTMHLWTRPGLFANVMGGVTGAAASLAMKSGVRKLGRDEFPESFVASPRSVQVWEVAERCLDPRRLLEALRDAPCGPIVETKGRSPAQLAEAVDAAAVLLTSGVGNEQLLAACGLDPTPLCQRRPLHMLIMHEAPFEFYGHCLQELSDKPRLTITTARAGEGLVWYLGGNVAETGIERSEAEQIEAAREELRQSMPWAPIDGSRWSTLRVDRAEGRTADGRRPDGPVVRPAGELPGGIPLFALWPTKLALAPSLAIAIASELEPLGLPRTPADGRAATCEVPVARLPWEP
jgi:hypothetical protein